ncbi:hypothetical protein CDAR_267551 [Caerostris darwini]|uniref:Uncharacterized protein n=1 Tax=Caerostris darwini TaxID=1538125 RepID=A0AAV4TM40_9ARAC|nr:hypothetical protein CDAR_267551 [Caerostris darwini]
MLLCKQRLQEILVKKLSKEGTKKKKKRVNRLELLVKGKLDYDCMTFRSVERKSNLRDLALVTDFRTNQTDKKRIWVNKWLGGGSTNEGYSLISHPITKKKG